MNPNAKIMIVDDEPDLLRVIGYALQTKGFEVITANDGMEALSKVAKALPDLMILDMSMPKLGGMEVCRQLRDNPATAHLPIIILSARGTVADKISGLEVGADEYLTKPIDTSELIARVRAMLARAGRLNDSESARQGRLLTFMGAKGGVGTTTVALNVASALQAIQQKSTALVELTGYFGSLSSYLQLSPPKSLGGILNTEPQRINAQALENQLSDTRFGLRVLFGPQKMEEFGVVRPKLAEAVFQRLHSLTDFVVVDLPSFPFPANRAVVAQSNVTVLVVEPDSTSITAGNMLLNLWKTWGVRPTSVGAVIVNRNSSTVALSLKEVAAQLACPIFGVLPPASEALASAQKAGNPLILHLPNHVTASTLVDLAQRIGGKVVESMNLSA